MPFSEAAALLRPLFGATAFELRYALDGRAAVRAFGGPLAPRHAEDVPPPAPWVAEARCGYAAGWLLAAAPPADPERASALLGRAVDRRSALRLQRLAAQRAALEADLLERLTHRLRTDVSTLQAVAEGAAAGLFDPADLVELPAEIAAVGVAAQRQLSAAREVMTALAPEAPATAEPLLETLRDELEAAGARVCVADVPGEQPRVLVPGAGWSACARLLAEPLARDARLAGATLEVSAHPDGWSVRAGRAGAGMPQPWAGRALDALAGAGHIVAAAGGSAHAERLEDGGLRVALAIPAAPSGPC
jgi:signal transduction histidine kinase